MGSSAGSLRSVVVVGANIAGLAAAEGLRRGGYDGRLTLVGDEPHVPYNRPPLSKDVLGGGASPESTMVQTERLARLDLDLRLGERASALDLRSADVEVEGRSIPFDALVVATGAAARRLPELERRQGVHTLRTLDDACALRAALGVAQKLVIVGAGFIGAEVAAIARSLGVEVVIVELADEPLAHALGSEMGAVCAGLHEAHGAELRCGTTVSGLEGKDTLERVELSDGTIVDADVLLVAVGVVPNTGWLTGSGLELRDGLICDRTLNAGEPRVYGAGDVARWWNELFDREMRVEHWTNADAQGTHAAANILAGPDGAEPFLGVNYVWSDQYGVRIQFAGTIADQVVVVDGSVADRRFLAWYRSGDALVGALAFDSAKLLAKSRRLIRQRVPWEEALRDLAA